MITPATLKDAATLSDLHHRAFDPAWTPRDFAAFLTRPAGRALMAADGFVLFDVADGESEILTLAVRPEARRQGLGARLMQSAMAMAMAEGAMRMTLEVAADNAAALALYARLRFHQVGRRTRYYKRAGDEIDALVLATDL
jgi:[ribosomal protein S18]-alanine N-acetyltransferase